MSEQPSKRRTATRRAARAAPRPGRAATPPATSQAQIKEIEERLVKLELLLATVRAEATKSTGAARLRLERIEKLVTTRIASTRASLKASIDRLGQTIVESKKSVEREVGLLTRGLKAGVRASREALRGKRDS